jgi:pimeloyl-ACP methyl ester carboxylesterase
LCRATFVDLVKSMGSSAMLSERQRDRGGHRLRRRTRAIATCLLGASLLASATHGDVAGASTPARVAARAASLSTGLIDVGGYRLFLTCAGTGAPTVLLEAGAGAAHDDWQPVFGRMARITRVCAYDRGGEGRSDRSPLPRTSQNIVAELHALLGRAQVPGPYVLVAHSIGGMYARLYAYSYLRSVAGMVLVDSSSEAQLQGRYAQLTQPTLPTSCAPSDTNCLEIQAFPRDAAEASAARAHLGTPPLGSLPLIVLTAIGDADPRMSATWNHEVQVAWEALQRDLAHLSSNSKQVLIDTGHALQWDDPGAVVTAVQQVVTAARSGHALQ